MRIAGQFSMGLSTACRLHLLRAAIRLPRMSECGQPATGNGHREFKLSFDSSSGGCWQGAVSTEGVAYLGTSVDPALWRPHPNKLRARDIARIRTRSKFNRAVRCRTVDDGDGE